MQIMSKNLPSLLVLAGQVTKDEQLLETLKQCFDIQVASDSQDALEQLRQGSYQAVISDAGDFLPLERAMINGQAERVLDAIGEGVAVVDADGNCCWTNWRLRDFQPHVIEKVKQICNQARSMFKVQAKTGIEPKNIHSKNFTIGVADLYYELIASPVFDAEGNISQVVAVVWDATSSKRLQQKLDAIDKAGRELGRLETDSIAKLTPGERLKLLRDKIIGYSKELMHFDHFAIRLLDKRCNKLEVVIAEGLPSEALEIDLYAQPEGNGICGYVAATGRSYICHDIEKDPRYVLGLQHAKSSLTVPLKLFDKVVGVYNIESCTVGQFNEDDRQFASIFGRYVAMALNILDLLVVERYTTTGQLADNVVAEIEHPLTEITAQTQALLEQYIGDDTMRGGLNQINASIEMIRRTLREVAAGPKAILGTDEFEATVGDPQLAGKRILIADDEPNIRQTIAEILGKFGCVCQTGKDGYEASTLIEQNEFDLVISDIKMPYRNGYEIFAAVQRSRDNLPVILMTGFGYDPNHSIVRASQEGLSGVIFKPFKIDQLIEEVRKAFDGGGDCGEADKKGSAQ
jgi:CheY-like chemotaxis protein